MEDEPVIRIDLDGEYFDITQDFINKYPESMIAKSMMVADGRETEPIEIDRDGKHFLKILEYSRGNRRAFNLPQMSPIDIKQLMNDLNFFGIADDLVAQCERELTFKNQRCIESVTSAECFKAMLVGESRFLIILSLEQLEDSVRNPENYIDKTLKLVDRDKCLIVGYCGEIEGIDVPTHWSSILYDPVTSKILFIYKSMSEESLLQMIHYVNTLYPYAILEREFTCDPAEEATQKGNIGKDFIRLELKEEI